MALKSIIVFSFFGSLYESLNLITNLPFLPAIQMILYSSGTKFDIRQCFAVSYVATLCLEDVATEKPRIVS